jgi:hypothetical protein
MVSASDFFLLANTIVQPSSESPSNTCSATLKGIPSSSASDSLPSETSGEKWDPLPTAAGDAPSDAAVDGSGAKVLRRLDIDPREPCARVPRPAALPLVPVDGFGGGADGAGGGAAAGGPVLLRLDLGLGRNDLETTLYRSMNSAAGPMELVAALLRGVPSCYDFVANYGKLTI